MCLVNTILNTVCILKLVFLKPVSPYIENDTAFIHGFSESLSSYTETSTAIWHGFCKTVCTNFNISAKIPCENPLHSPCLGQFSVRLLYIFYIGAGLLQTWVPEGWIRACAVPLSCLSRLDCFVRDLAHLVKENFIEHNIIMLILVIMIIKTWPLFYLHYHILPEHS